MTDKTLPLAVTYDQRAQVLRILDQRRLPEAVVVLDLESPAAVAAAIADLAVRGAPAIGVAAAFGLVLSAKVHQGLPWQDFTARVEDDYRDLLASRPTAVNLQVGLDAVLPTLSQGEREGKAVLADMEARALAFLAADQEAGAGIARVGGPLIQEGGSYLTICNAGALATANAYGTALAPFYQAHEDGRSFQVFACETRPVLQGARLTATELSARGIDVTLICDSMAGALMASRPVDGVFIGADRIAANGDTANKIGSYSLACLAQYHQVPLYVCAPETTIDRACPHGDAIPIERRGEDEIRLSPDGRQMVASEARVWNPAFDVVPHHMITGFVTELGLVRPPYDFTKEGDHA